MVSVSHLYQKNYKNVICDYFGEKRKSLVPDKVRVKENERILCVSYLMVII